MKKYPKTIVNTSSIDRKGLFAAEDIRSETIIIEYTGEKIDNEEADRRERINDLTGTTYIFIYEDQSFCIDGAVGGNDSRFANHSCDPNMYLDFVDGHIYFVADRDIKKGEELTYDYAFDYDPFCLVKCFCGSNNCRGTINELPPPDPNHQFLSAEV